MYEYNLHITETAAVLVQSLVALHILLICFQNRWNCFQQFAAFRQDNLWNSHYIDLLCHNNLISATVCWDLQCQML